MIKYNKKSILFYIGALAIVPAVVLMIVGPVMSGFAQHTFAAGVIVFLALGIAAQVFAAFTDLKFVPLLPVLFFSIAFGLVAYCGAPIIADFYNEVNFMDGDYGAVVAYCILSACAAGLACVGCFDTKK